MIIILCEKNRQQPKYVKFLMNNQNIEKWQIICFDEWWKCFFSSTPFYIGDIIYWAKIVRAFLSNYVVFVNSTGAIGKVVINGVKRGNVYVARTM